jgi:hypothetical protein
VVVHPGARERDLGVGVAVARGELREVVEDVLLGHALGQLERAVEAHRRRHVLEQLLDRARADALQHLAAVLVGRAGVARHAAPSTSFW